MTVHLPSHSLLETSESVEDVGNGTLNLQFPLWTFVLDTKNGKNLYQVV